MDQEIRNKLRNVVTQCRKLLEDSMSQELEGKYGIFAKKDQVTANPNAKMAHLAINGKLARSTSPESTEISRYGRVLRPRACLRLAYKTSIH